MRQTYWCHLHSSITPDSKGIRQTRPFFPYAYNRSGQKLIWHKVTKMRNLRYTFCRYLFPYRTLKVSKIKTVFTGAILNSDVGARWCSEFDLTWWPDLWTSKVKIVRYQIKIDGGADSVPLQYACWNVCELLIWANDANTRSGRTKVSWTVRGKTFGQYSEGLEINQIYVFKL